MAAAQLMASPAQASPIVDASQYDAFWLWAGVRPQPALKAARTLYILQGQVEGRGIVHLVSQRPAIPRIKGAAVWMVVRVETLDWPPHILAQILTQIERWRLAGNAVAGLQIDFDARTRHLDRYASFLKGLRAHLPATYKLSVTGLLDWSANGDPDSLAALAGTVDEIILQIYQGRRVIPGYQAYLARLDRLTIPFRIGLLQGGEWSPPEQLAGHPYFRGYVVFLLNSP